MTPGWVLTAAHVVADAVSIGVWLGAPQELSADRGIGVDPQRVLRLPGRDLALLPVPEQPGGGRVLLGRLDRDAVEPVGVVAAGFPWFKLRPAPDREDVELRELHLATGTIAASSDAKTGTFELAVLIEPSEHPQPDEHSPWEGMSGAAVWASGHVIGVVGQDHPREGRAVLTVRPLADALVGADPALEAWRDALPQLRVAFGLPVVTPITTRQLVVQRAHRAAEPLVPAVLVAREDELAELAAFTAGREQWRWVRTQAFAGKTALLASFCLHPPDDLDIAACFLRRTSGTATAFIAADLLARQLAVHAGREYQPAAYPSERVDDFLELLKDAAEAAAQRQRRLLLVVDGLDEDQTHEPDLVVARWLPTDLPGNTSLLVGSRAGVEVPLPPGHPLHSHRVLLHPSEAAVEVRQAAEGELSGAREVGGVVDHILGLLAAATEGTQRRRTDRSPPFTDRLHLEFRLCSSPNRRRTAAFLASRA